MNELNEIRNLKIASVKTRNDEKDASKLVYKHFNLLRLSMDLW